MKQSIDARLKRLEDRVSTQAQVITTLHRRVKGHAELITSLYGRLRDRGLDDPIPQCYLPLLETRPQVRPKLAVIPRKSAQREIPRPAKRRHA